MKRFLAIGISCLALGVAGTVTAQSTTTSSHVDANGAVHTTTRVNTPAGSAATHTVDNPDGTRTVTRRRTDVNGNTVAVRHQVGSDTARVCRTHWRHHHRVRTCYDRERGHG